MKKIGFLLLLFIAMPNLLNAWFFDNGLEDRVEELQQLFKQKELTKIYLYYVDPELHREVNSTIKMMKQDKEWGVRIAKRLGFKTYRAYLKADSDEVVRHFFYTMLYKKRKKSSKIKNSNYLQLSLALTLLVAPFDEEMKFNSHKLYNNGACVVFKSKKIKINAYFRTVDNNWLLTSKQLSKK